MAETISYPSALDPDFLLFALPLAAFLDIFGFASIFFSFGIAGFIVSLVLGVPLVIWQVKKEGNVEVAKERIEQLRTDLARAREEQKMAAETGKKGAKAGGIVYGKRLLIRRVLTEKFAAVMKRALTHKMARMVVIKVAIRLFIGSILVFFPYWLWSTFSVLRKR